MNIVAIVVTHNRPQLLAQTLGALQAQSHPLTSIIVVDNASDEETRQLLAQCEAIMVHRLDENTGGAGGFCTGVSLALEADADWIWLLDDDAIPAKNALEQLLHALPKLENDKIGALCSAVYEFGAIAPMHRRHFDPVTLREPVIAPAKYGNTPIKIDTGSFVGFLLNTVAAWQVGLPNRCFFLAYDDTEYSLRLKAANWSIWLIPTSLINHKRTQESRMRHSSFGIKNYYNLRNRLAVFRHYGDASKWRYYIPILKFAALALRTGQIKSIRLWKNAIKDSHEIDI